MINRFTTWLIALVYGTLRDWTAKWLKKWVIQWKGSQASDWLTVWLIDWEMNFHKYLKHQTGQTAAWLTVWLIGWLLGWLTDWLTGRVTLWSLCSLRAELHMSFLRTLLSSYFLFEPCLRQPTSFFFAMCPELLVFDLLLLWATCCFSSLFFSQLDTSFHGWKCVQKKIMRESAPASLVDRQLVRCLECETVHRPFSLAVLRSSTYLVPIVFLPDNDHQLATEQWSWRARKLYM